MAITAREANGGARTRRMPSDIAETFSHQVQDLRRQPIIHRQSGLSLDMDRNARRLRKFSGKALDGRQEGAARCGLFS